MARRRRRSEWKKTRILSICYFWLSISRIFFKRFQQFNGKVMKGWDELWSMCGILLLFISIYIFIHTWYIKHTHFLVLLPRSLKKYFFRYIESVNYNISKKSWNDCLWVSVVILKLVCLYFLSGTKLLFTFIRTDAKKGSSLPPTHSLVTKICEHFFLLGYKKNFQIFFLLSSTDIFLHTWATQLYKFTFLLIFPYIIITQAYLCSFLKKEYYDYWTVWFVSSCMFVKDGKNNKGDAKKKKL